MKPAGDKSHLFVTTEKSISVNIDRNKVKNIKEQQLFGIRFDPYLPFEVTLPFSVEKTSRKLHYLQIIVNMDLSKRKVLIKAFITPPFRFCSLIWMLHSRSLSNRFNNIQEKALRLAYKDKPVFI